MAVHAPLALECLRATGINTKSVANTSLGFTEADGSKRFVPVRIAFLCEAATAITVGATVSIGWTAAAYTDLFPATVLTNLLTQHQVMWANPTALTTLIYAPFLSIPPNTEVFARVSVVATGTSQTLGCYLWGHYV